MALLAGQGSRDRVSACNQNIVASGLCSGWYQDCVPPASAHAKVRRRGAPGLTSGNTASATHVATVGADGLPSLSDDLRASDV
jgi:hypothetical protein